MATAPSASRRVTLTVNGRARSIEVLARRTLAEALRQDLGLTGTKVGCNRAECGSCTVVLDGRAVFACSVLAVEAAGRVVETVEGLESPAGLRPLQRRRRRAGGEQSIIGHRRGERTGRFGR